MTELQTGPGAAGDGSDTTPGAIEEPASTTPEVGATTRRVTPGDPKVVRVVAAGLGLRPRLQELWRSRELLSFLISKDIKVKYKNSVLGFVWSMLNPALTLVVYFFVFKVILKSKVPSFAVYLFAGLLVWNLFLTAISGGTSAVVANSGIVKKVSFPREVLALATVGTSAVFFVFQAIVMALFMLVVQHAPAWGSMWLLIPALAALLMFTAALAVFLSAVNVYFRDIQHLVEVLLTVWFWALPIVYTFSQVQRGIERYHLTWVYLCDPLVPIVLTFQRVLYAIPSYVPPGSTTAVQILPSHPLSWYAAFDLVTFAVSAVLFFGALKVFGRLEGNFAEEL